AGAACADPSRIADRAVPMDLPPAQAFGGRMVRYADTGDAVVFTGSGRPSFLDASGGNDTIYAFDASSGTSLRGGSAADLIVVCSVEASAVSLMVHMGDGDTMKDLDSDILVLRPEVFRDVPLGFVREISVFDFLPANDRLFLWPPSGAEVTFTDRGTGSADVKIGDVVIKVYRSDGISEGPFNWESVVVAPAEAIGGLAADARPSARLERQPQGVAWRWGEAKTLSGMPATFEAPMPGCQGIEAPEAEVRLAGAFETERYNWDNLTYTHGDDLVRVPATHRTTKVRPGRGDDSVYLMDASDDLTVESGSGSDMIVICSMRGAILHLSPGPGVVDRHPDTIVVEPSVFQGILKGVTREIRITGFMPVNDRLTLRLPAGLEVKGRAGNGLSYDLEIGQVRIEVAASGFALDLKFDPEAITVVTGHAD
ncbi:hypothetical protein, partial [Mesorhizobium mediterraneum]|uniref:hypothetical protein n=1 Tax=Mesorhizobium mediterraneum TaxID=43617 RepID=UPI001AEDD33D